MVKLKKLHLPHPKLGGLSNNRLIAGLMTLTTLAIAISIVLSKTWMGDIGFNNKVISRKNAVKDTLEQNVAVLPQLQENFKFLEDNGPAVSEVLRALPTSVDYAALSSELEAAATLVGVQLLALAPQLTEDAAETSGGVPTPQPVVFQVNVSGSFAALSRFIVNMENSQRPIQLNSLSFSGTEPGVNLSAVLTTYWQPLTLIGDDKEEISEN